ncbi:MAG TPA: M14 family metallopeptidase, partial [Telluria sp.]
MFRTAFALALLAAVPVAHSATALTTISETSGFTRTGRYDEVLRLCESFQAAYPRQVKCFEFGRTPEGRPMMALAVNNGGALTPLAAIKRGLPVVFMQGGIHAGEIDGKDAGFLALREVLEGRLAKGALDKQVLVFVPVFNVDGHEMFGPWNRPNQRGPVEMGWRTTGQNFNLNRDYVKADSPEMAAMLRMVNAWDPIAYVDLHVTDGAKFQHDVSVQVEPVYAGDEQLRAAGLKLRDGVLADIAKKGAMPQPFYMSFAVNDDPMSGFVDGVSDPRFSTGYFQLRNRMAMLVETHSWKDYPTRVRITHDTIISTLEHIARHGKEWQQIARDADIRASKLASSPLTYKTTDKARMIDFKGYEYTRTKSDISGAMMTHYDETRPKVWRVPVRDEIVPDLQVAAPAAGYIV